MITAASLKTLSKEHRREIAWHVKQHKLKPYHHNMGDLLDVIDNVALCNHIIGCMSQHDVMTRSCFIEPGLRLLS